MILKTCVEHDRECVVVFDGAKCPVCRQIEEKDKRISALIQEVGDLEDNIVQ